MTPDLSETQSPSNSLEQGGLPPLWLEILLVCVVTVFPAIYYSLESLLFHPRPYDSDLPFLLDSLERTIVPIGEIFLILYLINARNSPLSAFGLTRPKLVDVPWFFLVLIANLLIVYGLFGTLLWESEGATSGITISVGEFQLHAATIAILAFGEELIFRSYLFMRITEITGRAWLGIVVPTVLFALSHAGRGPLSFVSALLFGLICALVFAKTRRLWPIACAHFTYNLLISARVYLG